MDHLSADHFLSLPRPDITSSLPAGVVDTTTLAAHDFDVDTRTGFMPPQAPLERLPSEWDLWEIALDEAIEQKLQLGDKPGLTEEDKIRSETWRAQIRKLPTLPAANLKSSEVMLRRAHKILAWIMHFYIQSLPPTAPVSIPPPITLPLLQVCAQLQLPPVLSYSDDVLYNWKLKVPTPDGTPTIDNLLSQHLFTGTTDEQEFYLTSARMELRGVEALELMRATMDEAFVGDAIAIHRISAYLRRMAIVIAELQVLLVSVREGCDPTVFYRDIRPWFRGEDSDPNKRKWVFEGLEQDPELKEPTELSGPSAGQSSLIHALDVFLGVDQYSHESSVTGSTAPSSSNKRSFLDRMQTYMPRHHRAFLSHLSSNPRPLRGLVFSTGDAELLESYNIAVQALKVFRDAHMIVVTTYIISPASRARAAAAAAVAADTAEVPKSEKALKGSGGTELVQFLKNVRDRTAGALISSPPS